VLAALRHERRRFVAEGIGTAGQWPALKGQIYLGSEQFVERMQVLIDPQRPAPRAVATAPWPKRIARGPKACRPSPSISASAE